MFNNDQDFDFSFIKQLFISLTTTKALVLLFFLGVIVYSNALFGEFVWDDITQIVTNQYIHSLNSIWFFLFDPGMVGQLASRFYRPLMFITYTELYVFFGRNTFFYHILQIGLHIANTSLVFLLFNKFFKKRLSFILAVIFLVHPINVETVSYIADLQDILYLFFGLFAVVLFGSRTKFNVKYTLFVLGSLLLSLLSKETGILFIPIIILTGYFFRTRKVGNISVIVSGVSLGIYTVLRYIAIRSVVPATVPTAQIVRTLYFSAPKMIYFYLQTFFYPKDLTIEHSWLVSTYSWKDFFSPLLVDGMFFFFIVLAGLFIWKKEKKQLLVFIFFLLWFIFGIVFHFQIWILDMTVADRWFYFPIIGLLGMFGVLCMNIHIKYNSLRIAGYVCVGILIFLLSVRTMVRNKDWNTRLGLYQHDVAVDNNIFLDRLLEEEYIRSGDILNARKNLNKMIHIYPNDPIFWSYKGDIEIQSANFSLAEQDYERLINTPYETLGYQALLQILIGHDRNYKKAKTILQEAIKKYPRNVYFWELLAFVDYKQGYIDEANQAAQHTNMSLNTIVSGEQ